MKLVTFTHAGATRIGIADGNEVVDLSVAAPDLPRDMIAFLAGGGAAFEAARRAAMGARGRIPLTKVRLENRGMEEPADAAFIA